MRCALEHENSCYKHACTTTVELVCSLIANGFMCSNSLPRARFKLQDTITGFLLSGMGNVDIRKKTNFLVVDSSKCSHVEALIRPSISILFTMFEYALQGQL